MININYFHFFYQIHILEIDDDYFEEREYPEDHKFRILKKINELRQKNNNANNESKPEKTDMDFTCLTSNIHLNEAAIEAGMNLLPANKEKRCCWNCLKVLIKDESFEKHFEEKIIKLKVVINIILIV